MLGRDDLARAGLAHFLGEVGGAFPALFSEKSVEGDDGPRLSGELVRPHSDDEAAAGDALHERLRFALGRYQVAVLVRAQLYHSANLACAGRWRTREFAYHRSGRPGTVRLREGCVLTSLLWHALDSLRYGHRAFTELVEKWTARI